MLKPKKLTVLDAAKLVGVGRPAFSTFLNGRAATTPDMASRIEVAFNVPAQRLLDMQAAFDAAQARAKGAPANAMPYVGPFLGIKAKDIETWVERNLPARSRLSVLLRTLANSTGTGITKIDFPGNDDAERPGWDGYIDAAQATPWIPEGISGWEFGVTEDIKGKADGDFAKSVEATARTERNQMTFVFVTPRHWPGKLGWLKTARAKGQWKDVRAYDSSDLEQWLEQSISGQAWFANETNRPSKGVRSLDRCWADWAMAANPPMAGSLFTPAVSSAARTLSSRLAKQPNESTVIAADSTDEALAFLAQVFGPAGEAELMLYRDRVLIFDEPGELAKLAQGTKSFIAVTANRKVEREMGPLVRSMQTIVVYPRNATHATPHVVLHPLNEDAFGEALGEMGLERDEIRKLSNESGRSLTVLRRRLACAPGVRKPEWASDHGLATSLIPFLFTGAWNSTNTADQTALTLLVDAGSYEELERKCQGLVGLDDAPLWSVGTYRGVVSKIDLLYAIKDSITPPDLERYLSLARMVLGEDDPRLDLPEAERWAAAIHGKSREFSTALREGISETLVLLAVHGNQLFRERLGFDCEGAVSRLVRGLLNPLKARILEANDRDLAAYAEAAPNEFLSILEEDLRADQPESYGLMRPAAAGAFGSRCPRTGLLWALEGLAWSPTTLTRAALVLAQLAEIEIDDNWLNKPINSLGSIFRAWMPQTAADHDARVRVMKLLAIRFPKVAWKICIEQFDGRENLGTYSHKPRWRNDAYGFGEAFKTWAPTMAFVKEMVDMALHWEKGHTREMLGDLIQSLPDLPDEHQGTIWELVKAWADGGASDTDKAFLREKIRVTILSRRGAKRSKRKGTGNLAVAAKVAHQALEPTDLLHRHGWLFLRPWVEESADELEDGDRDFRKREERIALLRAEALSQILNAHGYPGVFQVVEMGKAGSQIGWLMTKELLREEEIPGLLLAGLERYSQGQSIALRGFIAGAQAGILPEGVRANLVRKLKAELPQSEFVRLLLLAPFRRSTWLIVDELEEPHRQTYWNDIPPEWIPSEDSENVEAVERLIAAERPRAAFSCANFCLEALGPELLFRLMSEMVKDGKEQPGQYLVEAYHVEEAFGLLDKSPALTLEQKAGLEFGFLEVLSKPWEKREGYGIPNLEKYIEAHPEFFSQAIVWVYRRDDGGEDPPEWAVAPEDVQRLAERGYKLLKALGRIPGHNDLEELQADKLTAWVKTVRDTCVELGRLEPADRCMGNLFSNAPGGEDGLWPCEAVRQVMEEVHSKSMMAGAHMGLYNSRGMVWRGEGGDQERELAEKYRNWANGLQYSHPFVAHELLFSMVRTYEHEASGHDTEAGIQRRLR